MCIKAIIATVICLATSSYASVNLAAEKETSAKRDTCLISLGVAVNTFDTDFGLTSAAFPDGVGINFEDDFDLDEQVNFGWIGGYW